MPSAVTFPADASAPAVDEGLPARARLEAVVAFVAAGIFYMALYGEVPYHDAPRFIAQVNGGRFVWDVAHILLQPATLLWHWYLGFGESASQSQKHIHTFSTALGAGIFYATMIRLGIPRWQRICAVALVAGSASVIILAPSAHMKLVTYPFLNGAIYYAVVWEKKLASGLRVGDRDLLIAAVLLAIATAFLASCLAAAPFITIAAVLVRVKSGSSRRDAVISGVKFAALCGALFFALACISFILFSGQPLSLQGLSAALSDKADLGPKPMSMAVRLARTVFGTANNLINAPVLGATMRAWLGGEIADLRPYYASLAEQLLPWSIMLVLIVVTYAVAIRAAVRGAACLMLLAFLAGAQTWTIYYSLNDPEHWFLLTVPTFLLLLTTFPAAVTRWVMPVAAVLVVGTNLWVTALPTARYPLARYQAEVAGTFGSRDLLVSFAAYPGEPYLGFFYLPDVARLRLDQLLEASPTPAAFYEAADQHIRDAIARGGRVVAFGVFDPKNWDAPWPNMARLGMTKAKFLAHFSDVFNVRPLDDIAELKVSEITLRENRALPRP
jgi:hypothetical protein